MKANGTCHRTGSTHIDHHMKSQCKDDGLLDTSRAFEKRVFREIPIDHIHHSLHNGCTRKRTTQHSHADTPLSRTYTYTLGNRDTEDQIGAKDFDGCVSTALGSVQLNYAFLNHHLLSRTPHAHLHSITPARSVTSYTYMQDTPETTSSVGRQQKVISFSAASR